MAARYDLLLPNGDRAEAGDLASLCLAARTLIAEACDAGASSAWLRHELLVTKGGTYDGSATALLQLRTWRTD
jgi:hypothetical protein